MKKIATIVALLLPSWACTPSNNQQQNEAPPAAPAAPAAPAPPSPPPARTAPSAPAPKESLPEPKGPIDPKSTEAAGQVVQSYGALIEQKRWKEANALWGHNEIAASFQKSLSSYREVHLEIGNLGQAEGAAGSIFVTMPVVFYGVGRDEKPFRRPAEVVLRRVNDVDGSTEAQRRWHIDQINWGA